MIGLTIFLAAGLAMTTAACLVFLIRQSSSQRSSTDRSSESASKMMLEAVETSREVARQSTEQVRLVTTLTEHLLMGRPMPPTELQAVSSSETATSPTPDDLLQQLPGHIFEAVERDRMTAGTWPNPSEQLQPPSPETSDPEPVPTWETLDESRLSM